MAFKPEPMQRTVVIASRAHQRTVIETLHALRAAHLVDFTENREGELAEFRIGRPLPEGSAASEKLVRLRGLIRQLGLEGQASKRTFTTREIEDKLAHAVFQVEQDITSAAESRARVAHAIDALKDEESRLRPLASLPLNLEDYLGYENLAAFVGFTTTPVTDEVQRVAPDAVVFTGGEDAPFAIFAPKARAEAVNDVLFKAGYREHAVPAGQGPVADRLRAIESERRSLEERLGRAETELATLREKHGDFLVAAEEHLSIEVAKAEAPLSFATTENAFVVDAWVPKSHVKDVEIALVRATNNNVHIETHEYVPHGLHGMDDVHGGHDAHASAEEPQQDPPTMLRHGNAVKPFGFFTEMFSMPKYDEIDPTTVLAIAFPLFLGFMVGDLGLGLLMIGLGVLLARKLGHVEGLKELGVAMVVGGVVAAVVGGVVFQDAFGMPFGAPAQELEHLEHEGLLALDAATHEFVLTEKGAEEMGHGAVAGSAFTCLQFAEHVGEWPWTCMASGKASPVTETHPLLTKLGDQTTLLLLSILAAIVHLTLGLVFGIVNEWSHSKKHAAAKMAWLVILFALVPAVLLLLAKEKLSLIGLNEGNALVVTGAGVLVGGVALGITEGVIGVLEIPSMLSNLLSYLRIGAIAIAKGAMAVAFNKLTIVDVAVVKGGILFAIVGFIAFVLVQMLLFVLGLLSASIQAIRLNYVEFFTKFYKGGGEKFSPFGHTRRFSVVPGTAGGGKL